MVICRTDDYGQQAESIGSLLSATRLGNRILGTGEAELLCQSPTLVFVESALEQIGHFLTLLPGVASAEEWTC